VRRAAKLALGDTRDEDFAALAELINQNAALVQRQP
jgi:hypothetical protein